MACTSVRGWPPMHPLTVTSTPSRRGAIGAGTSAVVAVISSRLAATVGACTWHECAPDTMLLLCWYGSKNGAGGTFKLLVIGLPFHESGDKTVQKFPQRCMPLPFLRWSCCNRALTVFTA